ncbi:MAG TPA: FAD-dependent oxidoreductase [Bacteroidota bacterium]|nr:FAD-dependent oxidoreductase [Bacteroidota bacterium]
MNQTTDGQDAPTRIIGGGMTGLTLALRLVQRGIRVVVHERDPYLGGLSSESTLANVPVERFYHCVLPTDTALLGLLKEVGLEEAVGWNRTRTGFFTGTSLLEMTTVRDFMRFPALKVIDRFRLGWTIAYCGLNRSWSRLDKEPIGPFLRRHGGRRLFESIWEPLLLSKLGRNYDRFAASFIWATVYRMLSARSAKGRSEKLGFVRGRYGRVFAALRAAIEAKGGTVQTGEQVLGINHLQEGGWSVHLEKEDLKAGAIVLCVPAPIAVQWLNAVHPDAIQRLRDVEYLGVVCEILLLKRSATPYYVLNLTDRNLAITGVIETSNLTGRDEFQGMSVLYLPRYCEQASGLWDRSDEDIHEENMNSVRRIVSDIRKEDVVSWKINRARYVQPIHPVRWGERIPPVRLAPRLAYVSTAQIHPWPVFNDEAIRNVDKHLEEVLNTIRK